MTDIHEENQKKLDIWLKDRPKSIKDLSDKIKPWNRYRIKETGQHCTLASYFEDGTVMMTVDGHDSEILDATNKVIQIDVFGITTGELELI